VHTLQQEVAAASLVTRLKELCHALV